jgi:phenylalanyl-tRNA synthetase beta chain
MKVPVSLLKEYVEFSHPVKELADKLTMQGLEVSSIEEIEGEWVIELEITPNRGDCLSILGIAREVAAITKGVVKPPSFSLKEAGGDVNEWIKVTVVEPELCPIYTARIIKGVKVDESPSWLKKRLHSLGIRTINNVVDITNFVLMEIGQPLHAFDYDKICGRELLIRKAKEGESITTLDGVVWHLTSKNLVIADSTHPIAIAGVMGGADCEVNPSTTNIVLESAYFNPSSIHATSKNLRLSTESSLRFERGVDPLKVKNASDRAAYLLHEICGGEVISGVIDKSFMEFKEKMVDVRPQRVNKILGTELDEGEVNEMLSRLGFKIIESCREYIRVKIPSFRHDLSREIDLVEEIARIYGYERIPPTLPKGSVPTLSRNKEFEVYEKVREILIGCGLYEVITYTFTNLEILERVRYPVDEVIELENPLSELGRVMCRSLIPNMLKVILWNVNRGNTNLKIFEVGKVYTKDGGKEDLPNEKRVVSGALVGWLEERNWMIERRRVNFFDLLGVIDRLLKGLGVTYTISRGIHPTFHSGRCANIKHEEKILGVAGELHPKIGEEFKLQEVYLFELYFDKILPLVNLELKFHHLPKYPSIKRDLSIIVSEEIESGEIIKHIKKISPLVEQVELFDYYKGKQIPLREKSLGYTLTYRNASSTLTDKEVNELHLQIIKSLERTFGAKLRE